MWRCSHLENKSLNHLKKYKTDQRFENIELENSKSQSLNKRTTICEVKTRVSMQSLNMCKLYTHGAVYPVFPKLTKQLLACVPWARCILNGYCSFCCNSGDDFPPPFRCVYYCARQRWLQNSLKLKLRGNFDRVWNEITTR